jgi:AcrR family transcriptional regulator
VTRANAAADQRRRILRATGELIAKRGYGSVTIELIANRAHVSLKTFYKHFDNKEHCFEALYDRFIGEAEVRINTALAADLEAPWPEQVIGALRAIFEVILEDPILARATIVEGLTVSPEMVDRYERSMSALAPLIRRGREYNPVAAELPGSLEDTISGGVLWIPFKHLIISEIDDLWDYFPESVEFVLRPYLGDAEAARWAAIADRRTESGALSGH